MNCCRIEDVKRPGEDLNYEVVATRHLAGLVILECEVTSNDVEVTRYRHDDDTVYFQLEGGTASSVNFAIINVMIRTAAWREVYPLELAVLDRCAC